VSDEPIKFYKAVWIHYSGEAANVYIILQQIDWENGVPNFVTGHIKDA